MIPLGPEVLVENLVLQKIKVAKQTSGFVNRGVLTPQNGGVNIFKALCGLAALDLEKVCHVIETRAWANEQH